MKISVIDVAMALGIVVLLVMCLTPKKRRNSDEYISGYNNALNKINSGQSPSYLYEENLKHPDTDYNRGFRNACKNWVNN